MRTQSLNYVCDHQSMSEFCSDSFTGVNIQVTVKILTKFYAHSSVWLIYRQTSTSPRRLVVGNIHVLFNPKRGDIKLGQVCLARSL